MSKYKTKPVSPDGIKTYSLLTRKNKVCIDDFAGTIEPNHSFTQFLDSLPDILAGRDFKEFVALMRKAKERKKNIIFALGAHVVKVGLSPVIVDLMKRGWISALSLNGAGIIHDFEVAFTGGTSEDVEDQIKDGQFGMAHETGEWINDAITSSDGESGLGECIGRMIARSDFPHKNLSLLGTAYEMGIPVTVHVAIGTDFVHFHPKLSGEALGKTSLRDFFLFCSLVEKLNGGGIFINVGSAVILPEVFLKALSFVRNQGTLLEKFYTAVFDFIHHYRPYQNVVKRPIGGQGKGFYFIGHHEIMIPLLSAVLKPLDI